MKDLTEERVSSELIFKGRVVHLYRDVIRQPDGHNGVREYVRHPGAVCVVPLTDDGCVIVVRQYRYAFRRELLEIPAGKLEPGENPDEAVLRELEEETGTVADSVESLGDIYSSVAILDEKIRLYLARGLHETQAHPDEDEFLKVEKIPLSDLLAMVMRGEICDSKTQIAILKTAKIVGLN